MNATHTALYKFGAGEHCHIGDAGCPATAASLTYFAGEVPCYVVSASHKAGADK